MNIGIDIDDTISDSFESVFADSQKFDIEELGNSGELKEYGKIAHHNYIETLYSHWSDEQTYNFWSKYFINMLTKAKPKPYVVETLDKLRKEGNKIIIITSRYEVEENSNAVEQYTKQWLVKNNINYDKLIINAQDKSIIAQENNIDLFIDDSIEHCRKMLEKNIKTLLYTSICNQGVDVPELERVYSWVQIYDKYKKIEM
ncbi:MAG: HAD hydrolase-like protein [Clostridia bacterium]